MLIGVGFIVYVLAHFKYSAMLTDLWNYLFKDSKEPKSLIAPLGISFITFSAISYLADIYKGKAQAGNLIDCALYMTFFPKVVSGPIVLWRDFKGQIKQKDINFSNFVEGLNRLMIGFAKKLILADTFGACIASISGAIDIPTAFGVSILFMLQIYYDFSGYSDIAIGLSKMLGIDVKENFNFPYLSTSISDFWRRWHISLGTWFREYVYIPLGGNRKGTKRTIINIAVVFLLTGIWHGAGWTYILWGAINGFCNIIEKLIGDKKFYVKTPAVIKWVLTMAITFVCWQIFRSADINACVDWFKIMFGQLRFDSIPYNWKYYFDAQMITLMSIAIVGSTVFGIPQVRAFGQKLFATTGGYVAKQILILLLFVLSIMFMVNSGYSPFLYFQY